MFRLFWFSCVGLCLFAGLIQCAHSQGLQSSIVGQKLTTSDGKVYWVKDGKLLNKDGKVIGGVDFTLADDGQEAKKTEEKFALPLHVRVMGKGMFVVDGKGPLDMARTKRAIEKHLKGKKSMSIFLSPGRLDVDRKDLDVFLDTLKNDWKVFEGMDGGGIGIMAPGPSKSDGATSTKQSNQIRSHVKPNGSNKPGTGKQKLKLNIDGPPQVTLIGHIEPITFSLAKFAERWGSLNNLRVAERQKEYLANAFRGFLPDDPVSIGAIWRLNENVVNLLKQLHPEATLNMHIDMSDSAGRWATLRAYNDQLVDIVFRIHAEFVLPDGYFTPSQFSGRLVLDRKSGDIVYFKTFVPDFTLNFDVNWGSITDSGYCKTMELTFGREPEFERIQWSEEVPLETTLRDLAAQFYPAWNINWVSMEDALQMARRLKKPLHIISADGPFKDEAC